MFRRYSLRVRLMMMVAPVFFGLSFLSALLIYQGYQNLSQANGIREAAVYSDAVSDLIHELQKERGVSSLFASGKANEEKLKEQRAVTDKNLKVVEQVLEQRKDDIKLQGGSLLKQLPDLRNAVNAKGDAEDFIRRYGELVRALIQTEVSAAQKHHLNGLEAKLVSASILEMGKENMGRLRASASAILAADKPIGVFQMRPIEAYHNGITNNLQSPGLNISEEARNQVGALLESPEWNEINAVVITIVNKWSEGFYGYPSFLFFDKITGVIETTRKILDDEIGRIQAEAEKAYQRNLLITAVILALTIVAQLVVFVYAWITLKEVSGKIKEYGESLYDGAGHTARASAELSSSSADLSSGMSEQAAAIQQTVSALEEVRTMVEKNAESAARAKDVMVVASDSSRRGKDAVEGMTHAIVEIRDSTTAVQSQVEASNAELSEILKVISEIGSKTKVINDIVFQTKLLSFNASVEAARAGEHGKGFAVVAEEVGNLAQMSGNSAREIAQLLDSGIKRVEAIIADSKEKMSTLIQEANGKVETGTSTAQRLGEAFGEISGKILEVSDRVAEIAAASQEQSQGVSEIAKAMHQLESVTNRSNEAAGRSASSAEKLSDQARNLEAISRQLEELVHGLRKNLRAAASAGAESPKSVRKAGSGGTGSAPKPEQASARTTAKASEKEPAKAPAQAPVKGKEKKSLFSRKGKKDSKPAPAPVISLSDKRKEKGAASAPVPMAAAVGAKETVSGSSNKADEVPSAADSRFEEI